MIAEFVENYKDVPLKEQKFTNVDESNFYAWINSLQDVKGNRITGCPPTNSIDIIQLADCSLFGDCFKKVLGKAIENVMTQQLMPEVRAILEEKLKAKKYKSLLEFTIYNKFDERARMMTALINYWTELRQADITTACIQKATI